MLKPNICWLSFWHGLEPPIYLLQLHVFLRVCVCVSKL